MKNECSPSKVHENIIVSILMIYKASIGDEETSNLNVLRYILC